MSKPSGHLWLGGAHSWGGLGGRSNLECAQGLVGTLGTWGTFVAGGTGGWWGCLGLGVLASRGGAGGWWGTCSQWGPLLGWGWGGGSVGSKTSTEHYFRCFWFVLLSAFLEKNKRVSPVSKNRQEGMSFFNLKRVTPASAKWGETCVSS